MLVLTFKNFKSSTNMAFAIVLVGKNLFLTFKLVRFMILSPFYMFFTPSKCTIFKNIMTQNDEDFIEGQYTLLSPAEQQVKGYNYKLHGFTIPILDMRQYEAFSMVVTPSVELPALWDEVFPSETELCLMNDSVEAKMLQKLFG